MVHERIPRIYSYDYAIHQSNQHSPIIYKTIFLEIIPWLNNPIYWLFIIYLCALYNIYSNKVLW